MLPGLPITRVATAILVVASVGSIDFAAQTTSPSPAVVVPYGDRPFTPLNPSVSNGTEIAVLRGDPAKGPSTMLMKMRKASWSSARAYGGL